MDLKKDLGCFSKQANAGSVHRGPGMPNLQLLK